MKRLVLGSIALIGVTSILGAASSAARGADGIAFDVGGFSNMPYQGVFDPKTDDNTDLYATPKFGGFQLRIGTPTNPGTTHNRVSTYATYQYKGDGWGLQWVGGGSWQTQLNGAAGPNHDKSSAYQTGLNLALGQFGIGGVMAYYDQGGLGNDAYVLSGGLSYTLDSWIFGVQGSHGHYNGETDFTFVPNPGGGSDLNRVIATGQFALAPGITLDGEIGYTWFSDSGDAADTDADTSHGYDIAIGSAFTF
jgi:hypothetical protein